MKKSRIGIIGCGTIGTILAKAVLHNFRSAAKISFLCDHHSRKAQSLKKRFGPAGRSVQIMGLLPLIKKSDIVVEAASAAVAGRVARESLQRGKQVLIMSVGGLISNFRFPKNSRGKLWVPSGAIAGIDALNGAREAPIRRVTLKTYKPLRALAGAPYFSRHPFPRLVGKRPVRIFSGSALAAIRNFPQNINVAAILSLAGLGPSKTRVEIWTSNAARVNQHEVIVSGEFGEMRTVTRNRPSPGNPKTSYLAALSAVATLRKIFSSVRIGT